ncbi:hypothetical protein BH23ACT11_BH23ACT11_09120 [soil metagenome]
MALILVVVLALGFVHFDPLGSIKPLQDTKVVDCDGRTVTLEGHKAELLRLHNEARAEHGVSKICIQGALMIAAQKHAEDMIQREYYAHETPEGVTPADRVSNDGYDFATTGENNNMATKSSGGEPDRDELKDTVKSWMDSPGHRENLLNPAFREIGIGFFSGQYKGNIDTTTMYVVEFGTRR